VDLRSRAKKRGHISKKMMGKSAVEAGKFIQGFSYKMNLGEDGPSDAIGSGAIAVIELKEDANIMA